MTRSPHKIIPNNTKDKRHITFAEFRENQNLHCKVLDSYSSNNISTFQYHFKYKYAEKEED